MSTYDLALYALLGVIAIESLALAYVVLQADYKIGILVDRLRDFEVNNEQLIRELEADDIDMGHDPVKVNEPNGESYYITRTRGGRKEHAM